MITIYIGWKISDPEIFLKRFDGDVTKAKQNLENLVRDAKNGVIGQHPFSDLISTQEDQLKFDEIEAEMLASIQPKAKENYGIEVEIVGIKQLGLPEAITGKVFERMREERQRLVLRYQGEGEARSIEIKAQADRERREILAEAEAKATIMMGEAEAEANKYYQEFEESPELAVFLLQLKALKAATAEKTTLILDPNTKPFNLLRGLGDSGSRAAMPTKDSDQEEKLLAKAVEPMLARFAERLDGRLGSQLADLASVVEKQRMSQGTELNEMLDELVERVSDQIPQEAPEGLSGELPPPTIELGSEDDGAPEQE